VIIQHLEEIRGTVCSPEFTSKLPLEGVPVLYSVEALGVDDGLRSAPTARSRSPDVRIISCGSYQVLDGPYVTFYLLVPLQGLASRGFSLKVRDGVPGHKVRDDIPGNQ